MCNIFGSNEWIKIRKYVAKSKSSHNDWLRNSGMGIIIVVRAVRAVLCTIDITRKGRPKALKDWRNWRNCCRRQGIAPAIRQLGSYRIHPTVFLVPKVPFCLLPEYLPASLTHTSMSFPSTKTNRTIYHELFIYYKVKMITIKATWGVAR